MWQHFSLPPSEVDEDTFEEGLGFDGSSIRGWQQIHKSDMMAVCDATTAVVDPFFTKPTVSVIANIVPKEVKTLTDAALAGNLEQARQQHLRLFKLAKAMLTLETNPIPIKTAMAIKGMITEEFRLPLCQMSPANKEKLQSVMADYGLL